MFDQGFDPDYRRGPPAPAFDWPQISWLASNWLKLTALLDRPPPKLLISQINFRKGGREKGEFEGGKRSHSSLLAMESLHLLVCVEMVCVCLNKKNRYLKNRETLGRSKAWLKIK